MRDAAGSRGAAALPGSGINREVVVRVRLEASNTHSVPSLVSALSIRRLRSLAQIVGISPIMDYGAASGIGRPDYNRPGIAHAYRVRSLQDLQIPCSLPVLGGLPCLLGRELANRTAGCASTLLALT